MSVGTCMAALAYLNPALPSLDHKDSHSVPSLFYSSDFDFEVVYRLSIM